MRGIILVIFFFIILPALSAQDNSAPLPVLFRGVVISASTGERIANVQILKNGENSRPSGTAGTFAFYAWRHDTVIFACLGYKAVTMVISDTLKGNEFITGIYMQSDTLDIGEVVIIPWIKNLKAEILNPIEAEKPEISNARNNISIAAYQGRSGQGRLGDPATNYELLRQKQKIEAYEKGGIPSDKIAGLNPFIVIPAAYMLIKGRPEPPKAPEPSLTERDMERITGEYKRIRAKVSSNSDSVRRN